MSEAFSSVRGDGYLFLFPDNAMMDRNWQSISVSLDDADMTITMTKPRNGEGSVLRRPPQSRPCYSIKAPRGMKFVTTGAKRSMIELRHHRDSVNFKLPNHFKLRNR
jgi:hypothetical protein